MSVELKPGRRFRSQVCDTEVVTVRAPGSRIDLRCGGTTMVEAGETPAVSGPAADGFATGTLLGKRYADAEVTVELLCVKAGEGALSIGDTVLEPAVAKPLPSSD